MNVKTQEKKIRSRRRKKKRKRGQKAQILANDAVLAGCVFLTYCSFIDGRTDGEYIGFHAFGKI